MSHYDNSPQNHTLRDLLMQGRSSEFNIGKELSKVKINSAPYSDNVKRIKDGSFLSPHLNSRKIFAAVKLLGSKLDAISVNSVSNFGTEELDLKMKEKSMPTDRSSNFQTVEITKFGNARLIGSPDSNLLILTTEGGNVRRGIKGDDLDDARRWLSDHQLSEFSDIIVSQYHLDGPNIYTESVAFIIKQ